MTADQFEHTDRDGFTLRVRPHPTRDGELTVEAAIPGGVEGVWVDVPRDRLLGWLLPDPPPSVAEQVAAEVRRLNVERVLGEPGDPIPEWMARAFATPLDPAVMHGTAEDVTRPLWVAPGNASAGNSDVGSDRG